METRAYSGQPKTSAFQVKLSSIFSSFSRYFISWLLSTANDGQSEANTKLRLLLALDRARKIAVTGMRNIAISSNPTSSSIKICGDEMVIVVDSVPNVETMPDNLSSQLSSAESQISGDEDYDSEDLDIPGKLPCNYWKTSSSKSRIKNFKDWSFFLWQFE